MKQYVLLILMASLLHPLHAYSAVEKPTVASDCARTESVTLAISFKQPVASPANATQAFNAMVESVKAEAKQQQIEKLLIQSMNYTVTTKATDKAVKGYVMGAKMSVSLKGAAKAVALLEALAAKGMNLGMTRYTQKCIQ
jgi:hypothetical protein